MTIQTNPQAPSTAPVVAVVEDDAVLLTRLVSALAETPSVRPFTSLDEVLDDDSWDPASGLVLVLGPSQVNEVVLDRVGAAVQVERSTAAIVVIEHPDATALRLVVRSGLQDAIALEDIGYELAPAVQDVGERIRSTPRREQAIEQAGPPERRSGRVVAVYSPKGGCGKSVVAVNLASALAADRSRAVALVDLDVQFGDDALMLRMRPEHNITDAAIAGDRLDDNLLDSMLARDDRTGLRLLAAPPDPTAAEAVTSKTVSCLLEVLRGMADYVVVDLAPVLDDVVLQTLSEADEIVYVVGLDVPSVKNARLGLHALESLDVPLQRILLVLNRADSRVHLAAKDVEKTLRMKVDIALPSDALVPQSVNRGVPAVIEFERSRFSARMRSMAELVVTRSEGKVRS